MCEFRIHHHCHLCACHPSALIYGLWICLLSRYEIWVFGAFNLLSNEILAKSVDKNWIFVKGQLSLSEINSLNALS